MQILKLALLIAPLLSISGVVASSDSADIVVPYSPKGIVAGIEVFQSTGETRLFSQNAFGEITHTCVSGPYTTGHTATGTVCGTQNLEFVVVPANETMMGTPIAAFSFNNGADTRFYFFSSHNVLSEYKYEGGWRGGPTCSDCITTQGFVGVKGSQVLYAIASAVTSRMIRVGFISAGTPETISEVVFDGTTWQIAGLPV